MYVTLQSLKVNGELLAPGTELTLPREEAESLLERGVIERQKVEVKAPAPAKKEPADNRKSGGKGGGKDTTGTGKTGGTPS